MRSSRIPHSASRISSRGFTLIELLVAVAVLAILVAVAARGLMTSMKSDEASALIFEGNLVMSRLEAAAIRNEPASMMKTLAGPGWQFSDALTKPEKTNDIPWRVLSLQSEVRPSLQIQTALRAD